VKKCQLPFNLGVRVALLARTSERSLITSDPGATEKFSEIPLEICENLLEISLTSLNDQCHGTDIPSCTWVTGAC